MPEQSVIGVYASMADAEEAIGVLDDAGFPIDQVSLVARDFQSDRAIHSFVAPGNDMASGAAIGASLGGLFGLLAGAAFFWVPVIGPVFVAGPLAASLLGVLEGGLLGAAGGGLLGALIGWGVTDEQVPRYEAYVRGGKYLVIAHSTADQVAWAYELLREESQATDLTIHGAMASAA